MDEEYLRHIEDYRFEDADQFLELWQDYTDACEYFEGLYPLVDLYAELDSVTLTQFDDIDEALMAGQRAVQLSGVLSSMRAKENPDPKRSELIKKVSEVLMIRRAFIYDPKKQLILDHENEEEVLLSGDFACKDQSEFDALMQDYIGAWEYFEQLYSWADELKERDAITSSEFDEIDQALDVGQAAMRASAKLSALSTGNYDSKPRDMLIKSVGEVFRWRRSFLRDPSKTILYDGNTERKILYDDDLDSFLGDARETGEMP